MSIKSQVASVKNLFTILDWLPGYKARWLRFDILVAQSDLPYATYGGGVCAKRRVGGHRGDRVLARARLGAAVA